MNFSLTQRRKDAKVRVLITYHFCYTETILALNFSLTQRRKDAKVRVLITYHFCYTETILAPLNPWMGAVPAPLPPAISKP